MKNLKKKINKIKTDNFLQKFPILFLLQHTNFSVNDWFDLKIKMGEFSEKTSPITILNGKNNVLKQSLSPDVSNSLKILLQGPNFFIGCQDERHSKLIWNYIQSHPKLIFISCIYKDQILNHLDFEKFLKLDSSVYLDLLFQLDKKTEFYQVLQHNLTLYPLNLTQHQFLACFNLLKNQ